ncbi:LysR family transcriptional regulator [Roseibium sp. M-1]
MKQLSLEAFVAVVDVGTVTGAAELLRRTQPQVSRLITELETDVGFELFVRERRRLVPTQRGMRFYFDARRVLNGVDDLRRIAEEIRTGSEAVLRIMAPPYIANTVLAPALCAFRERYPNRRFAVELVNRNYMGNWMSFQPFDVGIASLPFELPSIRTRGFAVVDTVVVLPKRHDLLRHDVIEIKDLDNVPFVALSRSTPLRRLLEEEFTRTGLKLNIVGEAPGSGIACDLVAHGLGITIVDALQPIVLDPKKLEIRPWKPGYSSVFGLVFPSETKPTAAALEFGTFLMEATLAASQKFIRRMSERG